KSASALRASAEQHGLRADLGCTTDAARILRIPGTYNRKPEYHGPRLVKVVHPEGGDVIRYDANSIEDRLAGYLKAAANDDATREEGAPGPETSHIEDVGDLNLDEFESAARYLAGLSPSPFKDYSGWLDLLFACAHAEITN